MSQVKALFLDRDGIINVDSGYVSKIENFTFSEAIFELLTLFKNSGYLLFIVTNQSGIGRGYYTLNDFHTLTQWMIKTLAEKKINIEKVAYCPHAPEENCLCRKPSTGMVDNICQEYNIDLSHSWLIGDKQSDIDLAHNSQIAHTIAISNKKIDKSEYHFESISECYHYIQTHQEMLS